MNLFVAFVQETQIENQCFVTKINSRYNLQGNSGNFVKLVKNQLQYNGPEDLTQYFVQSFNITDNDEYVMLSTNGDKGIQVDFLFSRKLLNQVITVFLPCIALCIVSFSTSVYRVNNIFIYFDLF